MTIKNYLTAAIIVGALNAHGQNDTILFEGFESANDKTLPANWSEEYIGTGRPKSLQWKFRDGGAIPTGSLVGKPASAHNGNRNAFLYYLNPREYDLYLVSPVMNFKERGVAKPMLKFWYSQYKDRSSYDDDSEFNNFEITVYYRTHSSSEWEFLRKYSGPTDDIEPWKCDSIMLPASLKEETQVQIAFAGTTKNVGYGCCIDDITIVETQVTKKKVNSIVATQPTTNTIATSSIDNDILRLRINVTGNSDSLPLKSLTATALKQTSKVTDKVKLYYTETNKFDIDSTSLLSTTTFDDNGKATFSNINFDLPAGNNFLWIACDIKDDEDHRFRNCIVDMKIDTNSINIGGRLYPGPESDTANMNPFGQRVISESIFIDDFEDTTKTKQLWTWKGEFEHDYPNGLGGKYGQPDPKRAHSGEKILGTDLTGKDIINGHRNRQKGDYETDIENQATSKTFDCYYYKDINLMFYRWLNVGSTDTASVDLSINNGESWSPIWKSTSVINDREWTFQLISLKDFADRQRGVKLRFSIGPANSSWTYSGWNLDDVALIGTYVYMDAALTEIITPNTGCGLTDEQISVSIMNVGYNTIKTPFIASYSIDGGKTWVDEIVTDTISRDSVLIYTFDSLANLRPTFEKYNIRAKVTLVDEMGQRIDEDRRNDEASKTIMSFPYLSLPYAEDFEENNGYWTNYGKSETWQYGKPIGTVINTAGSGARCWSTNLKGAYLPNDTAVFESPCFDMSNVQKPILEFKLNSHTNVTDGLAMYYSINEGINWELISNTDTFPHPSWNWYNTDDTIDALGTIGWTDSFGWKNIKKLLPDTLAGQSSVKLRFVFASASESNGSHDGFAIDDIRIYESPVDAGVAAIVSPVDSCSLSKEQPIIISIKNYGVRSITNADSLFASIRINDKMTLTDTFQIVDTLPVGDSINFTFNQTVNMWSKRTYNMVAYTHIKGDTLLFSNINNDTLRGSATVLGEPLYSLGPDKGTIDPNNCEIDGGVQSDGTDFAQYEWVDNNNEAAKNESNELVGNQRRLTWLNSFPEDVIEYEYKIKVTNIYGCEARDTVKIINSQTDVGIADVITDIPSELCINHILDSITVMVKNFSDAFDIDSGTVISICYKILDADSIPVLHAEDTVLSACFEMDSSFNYTFKEQPKFGIDGAQKISFFTLVRADLDHSNDSIIKDITIWPLPTIDLGADSILNANPVGVKLSTAAIAGASYLWQSADTIDTVGNTFVIFNPETAQYKLTISDEHNCATVADSVLIVSDNWIMATEVISPFNICEPEENIDVTIKLTNKSNNIYPDGYTIPATIYFNGDTIIEPIVLTDTIAGDSTFEYTFNSKVSMTEVGGPYNLKVTISPVHDINRSDNTINEGLNVWGVPRVDLGVDTIFTQRPDTIKLDAGPDFVTYQWYENQRLKGSEQTFNATDEKSRTFVVNVTSEHGCYLDDQRITIYDSDLDIDIDAAADTVIVVAYDVAVDELISPAPSCDITQNNVVEVRIINAGLDVISANTVLPFVVKIGDSTIVRHTYKIQQKFSPNASQLIRLPLNYRFVEDKAYAFKIWLEWGLDRFNSNDTAQTVVSQYPHPDQFSLGEDIYTTKPDTVVLRAPKDYFDYAWSNNSTADTLQLSESGTSEYSVEVKNHYGCATPSSINVITYDLDFTVFTDSVKQTMKRCDTINTAKVYGKISVKSLDKIPAGALITTSYTYSGQTDSKNITLSTPITSESPYIFNFEKGINLLDTGNFVIMSDMTVNHIVDSWHEADTLNYKETDFRIGAFPIPFTDTVSTYDETYTINAGTMFNVYNWEKEMLGEQTLTVVKSGQYKLTAIDTNGCKAVDSTYILFIKPRYDIVGLGFDTTYCEGDGTAVISFYLKNTGNDIIAAGSQSQITYVADTIRVDEVFTFEKTLRAGDSTLVTFNQNADFNTVGSHPVTISADIAGYVASALFNVTTLELPTVLLGDDVNSIEQSVGLMVKSGYQSYLWNTNDTTPIIEVSEDGQYWVSVVHNNGCINSDTITVHFVPTTITVTAMMNPVPQCGNITNDSIVIEILNNGDATIAAGRYIGVTCTIDDSVIFNNIEVPWDFAKNATLTHKMENLLTISEVGVHTLKFALDVDGLPKDTSEYTVEVYAMPEFTFGTDTIRPKEYPYELASAPLSGASYLWNTNETTESIAINADGMYSLTITDNNLCQAFDSVFVKRIVPKDTTQIKDTTGINDFALSEVAVYPNPAKDVVNIDFNGVFTTGCRIMVARASGQIIYVSAQTSDIMKIDVSDWSQGVYLIRITNGKESRIIKFVKE